MEKLIVSYYGKVKTNSFIARFLDALSKECDLTVIDQYSDLTADRYISNTTSNSRRQLELSFNYSNASIVPITNNPNQALYWLVEDGAVLERTVKDKKLIFNEVVDPEELKQKAVYKRCMPGLPEFRVHVCNGLVCTILKKVPTEHVTSEHIKSKSTGYKYSATFPKINRRGLSHAVNVVSSATNFTFFAMDVLYNEETKEFYVSEVYSNPIVSDSTLQKYVSTFLRKRRSAKFPAKDAPGKNKKHSSPFADFLHQQGTKLSTPKFYYDEAQTLIGKVVPKSSDGILSKLNIAIENVENLAAQWNEAGPINPIIDHANQENDNGPIPF